MPKILCLLALSALALPATTFTPVHSSPGEPDLTEILDTVYGPGNYFRIDDDSDRLWQAGLVTVRALATFSAADETLGFCSICDGSDSVLFDQTFSADGIFSTPLTVGGESEILIASPFTWFDFADVHPLVGQVYSDPGMNPAGADHMVTFGVAGRPDTFVVGVEDWLFTANPASDRDYQDFVFEATIVNPEPSALFTLLGGLAALIALRRRR